MLAFLQREQYQIAVTMHPRHHKSGFLCCIHVHVSPCFEVLWKITLLSLLIQVNITVSSLRRYRGGASEGDIRQWRCSKQLWTRAMPYMSTHSFLSHTSLSVSVPFCRTQNRANSFFLFCTRLYNQSFRKLHSTFFIFLFFILSTTLIQGKQERGMETI